MEENRIKTELTGREKRLANLKRDAGPGRTPGQRNYATIYREALIKIAAANDKTPEEIEVMMEEAGLKQAIKGNFAFFKDVRDRIHGTATQRTDVTSGGKPLQVVFDSAFALEDENTTPQ